MGSFLCLGHLAAALILGLGACNGDKDAADDTGASDDTGGDGGTGSASIESIEAATSEVIVTVATVSWTTTADTTGHVAYGFAEDALTLTTPETASGTAHEVTLLGLKGSTEIFYQVVLSGGESSDVKSFTTTNLPNTLPALATEGEHDGWMATTLIGAVSAAVIFDADGDFVWYWFEERDLDVYRARLSVDGQSVLYNAASVSGDPAQDSELVRVSLDGTSVTSIPIPLLAHDFVEHSDGTLAAIAVEYRGEGKDEVKGNRLVEIAPDGTESTIWTAWDCFDPEEVSGDDPELGWTFANALDFDEEADAYYVGLRNFSSIAKVNRSTGACEWVFSGDGATFDPNSGSDSFLHQHQFEVTDDSIIVFDNEGSSGLEARAIEYSFDPESETAEEIWTYTEGVQSFVLGDVHRLDDGDTLVTWSVAGQINRADPDGESVWQLNSDIGFAFAFNTYYDDLYPAR